MEAGVGVGWLELMPTRWPISQSSSHTQTYICLQNGAMHAPPTSCEAAKTFQCWELFLLADDDRGRESQGWTWLSRGGGVGCYVLCIGPSSQGFDGES